MIRLRRKDKPQRSPLPTVLHPAAPGRVEPPRRNNQALEVAHNRVVLGVALFVIAFAALAFKLLEVVVLQPADEPRGSRIVGAPVRAVDRAAIVDRNGHLLATSLATQSLYAHPHEVDDADAAARKLARVLPEINAPALTLNLQSGRTFIWVRRKLTPQQQYEVNRLGLPGFYFRREDQRVYPQGSLAAHVVGFTDIDNKGLGGVELKLDDRLKTKGEPVELSLDIRVQHVLREELLAAQRRFSAEGAAGLVLDAETGEVLALVSLPDFEPNEPATATPEARFNRITLGVYEQGSTFKLFTAAMALDAGTTTLSRGYDASRPIQIGRFTISDYKGKNRWLTVPEIIVYSSNIGAVRMALDVGTEGQKAFLKRFQMLQAPSIELPEVGAPLVPSPWREINTMTIAFGHGLSVSPLQMANGVAALVNGGILRPATLLKRAPDGPVAGRQVLKAQTSEQMRTLMRLVVTQGTGKKAEVPGYFVAGKTGTAEKVGAHGGYKRKALLSSFVGAFPAQAPRYVVLVMVDEPHGIKETMGYATGGWVAAPIIHQVIARMAPLLGIEPAPLDAVPDRGGALMAANGRPGAGR